MSSRLSSWVLICVSLFRYLSWYAVRSSCQNSLGVARKSLANFLTGSLVYFCSTTLTLQGKRTPHCHPELFFLYVCDTPISRLVILDSLQEITGNSHDFSDYNQHSFFFFYMLSLKISVMEKLGSLSAKISLFVTVLL